MQLGGHGRPLGDKLSSSDAEQAGPSKGRPKRQDSQSSLQSQSSQSRGFVDVSRRSMDRSGDVPPRAPRKIGSRHTEIINQVALTIGGGSSSAMGGGSRPGSRRTSASGSGGTIPLKRSQSFDLTSTRNNNYESDSNLSEASEGGRRRRKREKRVALPSGPPNQAAPSRKGDRWVTACMPEGGRVAARLMTRLHAQIDDHALMQHACMCVGGGLSRGL